MPCGHRAGAGRVSELLRLEDVHVEYRVRDRFLRSASTVRAVDGVSLALEAGRTLGVVGETGSGKSTLARAVLRLVPLSRGRMWFRGADLGNARGLELRQLRRHFQPVFQDSHGSLDPKRTVYEAIAEPLVIFRVARSAELHRRVASLLDDVGLSASHGDRYPGELSGGQRQRVGIARALALEPELIIADEPLSALDVSIQAQVINLFDELQSRLRLTYLFISHDLSVVRHLAHDVAVMYLGKVVEMAPADGLYQAPLHPYTQALMMADRGTSDQVPGAGRTSLADLPTAFETRAGCVYRARCPLAIAVCAEVSPPLEEKAPGHFAACHVVPVQGFGARSA
jgi:oligopeptide transport system ATP-binding protein